MNKLVSIIIPVYNGEKFIEECLNSILKQTYENYEVIVINDGSLDNTKEIVESFVDKRIRLFNIQNGGVSNARNYGIKEAKGDFILFVDADDKIDNKALEILINKQEESGADIIRFNGYIQDNKGKFSEIEMPVEDNSILNSNTDKEKIINLLNSPVASIRCYSPLLFIKNSDIINFNTSLTYLEDKLFYIENMTEDNKKILFVKDLLYYYNFNERSKTKDINNFKNNISDMLAAMDKISDAVVKIGCNSDIVKNSLLSLIINRFEYLATITKYSSFKSIMKDTYNIESFNNLLNFEKVKIRKIQTILLFFIKNKLYFCLYFVFRVKGIIKELKRNI